ncbi:hypothetical protein MLD38_020512 [Melastoma candidum]|uniref:Uncharacterized protein n=1 Tax=Melastoma candidum TaxID=119954 RepID=A0ACB9QG63_9MYRT|nr:hypothetical protein MLD38_020512 [Melastoma candidum]
MNNHISHVMDLGIVGIVGVAEDLNAIVTAFRGTHESSIQNWINGLYWKQLVLNYPGMPDAMFVHRGLYFACHNTTMRTGNLNAVEKAKEFYGDISIIVTGHSTGGAMAAFCGFDLTDMANLYALGPTQSPWLTKGDRVLLLVSSSNYDVIQTGETTSIVLLGISNPFRRCHASASFQFALAYIKFVLKS